MEARVGVTQFRRSSLKERVGAEVEDPGVRTMQVVCMKTTIFQGSISSSMRGKSFTTSASGVGTMKPPQSWWRKVSR